MKRTILVFFCLLLLLPVITGCFLLKKKNQQPTETTAGSASASFDASASESESAAITASPSVSDTSAATSSAEATESTDPNTPVNTATMYSSYAFMVSYDPARGWADFDYFDMLRGEDAVNWLVEHEGYAQADAQEVVDNYADSEFICKNTNPQLRTVDLRDLPLKLMYYPDGTMVPGAPIDATLSDLYTLYILDPDLILDSFFYWIEVEGGEVTSVEQVYWP